MYVRSAMKTIRETIYVNDDTKLSETLELLKEREVDGVPVIKGNKYVGIVTFNRIYKAYFKSDITDKEKFLNETSAGEIAYQKDVTVDQEAVFETTLLLAKNAPLIAVVDEKQNFIGIITRSDILDQFQSAFGMRKPGIRIAFASSETEGRIARLAKIAKNFHENIISLSTFDESNQNVRRIVMKIEKKENLDQFIAKLEQNGFKVLDIKEV
ncbi:CBS domain-containing protein [Guptibacillus hwajinpoensis]|uniref:CBS domain-containing protein n=1 Tax=Guptibacillus hwajinpoensis TaxID=208199 RepID=A0ABU0K0J1_9BACL|nr:CBS domain-containing protein [Alkalihalobacillus hemicentroti]MDQ0481943.1 CBS domain-containing protein [Alkalihalobacillus hemicentroti]